MVLFRSSKGGPQPRRFRRSRQAGERDKAANPNFHTLWQPAQPFFAEGSWNLATCPVCTTPGDASRERGPHSRTYREMT